MTVVESHWRTWAALQRANAPKSAAEPELPLHSGDGGGTSGGGMEARLAKLEAGMDYVKGELARLSNLPADTARIAERTGHTEAVVERLPGLAAEVARISERLNHMPTTAEMHAAIEAAVDRAGIRTQRSVAIIVALATLVSVAATLAPKLLGI